MPLFSTIAHPTAPSVRRRTSRSRTALGGAIAALVLIGLTSLTGVLESRSDSGNAAFTSGNRLTHDEFVRLNTVELPVLGKGTETAGDELVPSLAHPARIDPSRAAFIELNTTALEYPARSYVEPATGPR